MSDWQRGYDRPNSAPSYLDSNDFARGQEARRRDDERHKQAWDRHCKELQNSTQSIWQNNNTSIDQTYNASSTISETAKTIAMLGAVIGGVFGYFGKTPDITHAIVWAVVGGIGGGIAGAALHIAFKIVGFLLKIAVYAIGVVLLIGAVLSFLH